jgi:hypothetical protein
VNVLFYFILALGVLGLGSRYYSRFVGRIIGEKADRPTPTPSDIMACCWSLC